MNGTNKTPPLNKNNIYWLNEKILTKGNNESFINSNSTNSGGSKYTENSYAGGGPCCDLNKNKGRRLNPTNIM